VEAQLKDIERRMRIIIQLDRQEKLRQRKDSL
jgi:hypothetical protein